MKQHETVVHAFEILSFLLVMCVLMDIVTFET